MKNITVIIFYLYIYICKNKNMYSTIHAYIHRFALINGSVTSCEPRIYNLDNFTITQTTERSKNCSKMYER